MKHFIKIAWIVIIVVGLFLVGDLIARSSGFYGIFYPLGALAIKMCNVISRIYNDPPEEMIRLGFASIVFYLMIFVIGAFVAYNASLVAM